MAAVAADGEGSGSGGGESGESGEGSDGDSVQTDPDIPRKKFMDLRDTVVSPMQKFPIGGDDNNMWEYYTKVKPPNNAGDPPKWELHGNFYAKRIPQSSLNIGDRVQCEFGLNYDGGNTDWFVMYLDYQGPDGNNEWKCEDLNNDKNKDAASHCNIN